MNFLIRASATVLLLVISPVALGQDKAQADDAKKGNDKKEKAEAADEVLAGHSYHGEAFNEGPRQKAYLMGGTGRVVFPVTSKSDEAKKFIEQGVGQLHGFWYFEAERSFRQAAALDPECAMAYWGMALANRSNDKRSKGFIAEAVKRKDKVSERERLYIEALDKYIKADKKKRKERGEAYAKALERLLYKYPDDVEARSFLALQLYYNRSAGSKITSFLAVDALMQQVFQAEPMHSTHHYRIHLWDYERPETAVSSAAKSGQAAPAIAHMWHMGGHIFSRLKRYDDAAYQQEASARVDHAHMMRDRVLPDQIGNFAHNNEWLIRNLNNIGRVGDAIDLAKNMIELPRHPKYNTITRRGSTYYGRTRLFETLTRYERWEDLAALCETPYLEPTENEEQRVQRLRHLGSALYQLGRLEEADALLAQVDTQLSKKSADRDAAGKKAEEKAKAAKKDDKAIKKAIADARRPFDRGHSLLDKTKSALEGYKALAAKDFAKAHGLLKKAGGVDAVQLAQVQFLSGKKAESLKELVKQVDRRKNEVHPLAVLADLLWRDKQEVEAKKRFSQLREISASVDLNASPVFTRLADLAKAAGAPADWRVESKVKDDVGERVRLADLGPFRWQPSPAPDWTLVDAEGGTHTLKEHSGKPLVLIFYLGFECLHCAEQLHAFAPMVKEYNDNGFQVVAISSDNREGLLKSIKNYDKGKLPIPLLADEGTKAFKDYRAYDDFEKQPLHGTFVIDADGMVLWQDISFEPFMDPKFVLKEAKRLIAQRKASGQAE